MGQTLTEFITAKIADPVLREELLAELHWRGMDRDHGLIFEDSVEEIDTPTRKPQAGYRVQLRHERSDQVRYQVTAVQADKATVVPMRLTADRRSWEPVPEAPEEIYPTDELLTVVTHAERVFPGLVSTGTVGPRTSSPIHLAIRGENLHALRALNYSHSGAVDLIYIDPPYNTGNRDWIYNDRRVDANDGYRHSKWLAFMHRRLELAKELLKDSGILLVSIDDNEQHRLRALLDQILGEENFIATFAWRSDGNLDNQAKVKINHEYIHMYARHKTESWITGVKDPSLRSDSKLFNTEIRNSVVKNGPKNPVSDIRIPAGFPATFDAGVVPARRDKWPHYDKDLLVAGGKLVAPVTARSGWANARLLKKFIDGGFSPVVDTKGQPTVFELLPTGTIENVKGRREDQHHILTVLTGMGTVETAGNELRRMGSEFPFPKPQGLLKYLLSFAPNDGTIVDFFVGSGSTLEAVLRLNEEDGGTRQCIVVTSNELGETDEKALAEAGHAPGDPQWEAKGVFERVLRPRVETIITGTRPDGATYDNALTGQHRVEFFTLGYMDDGGDLDTYIDYDLMAPLLWARAGAVGPVPDRPEPGKHVVGETFAILFDTDRVKVLATELHDKTQVATVFVVADNQESYRQAASDITGRLDHPIQTIHLERTYLDSRSWIPKDRRRKAAR